MKINKMICSFFLALTLICSLSISAFAQDSSVEFKDGDLFVFSSGSTYSQTDLFDSFKGVMPGDNLMENIRVYNKSADYDYIKVYVRAEALNVDNIVSVDPVTDETVVSMQDFISQLDMKVTTNGKEIFNASANELDGLASNVLIATLNNGETKDLNVELNVPIELSNKYANRIGEVDWVFVVEGFINPVPDTGDNSKIIIYGALMLASVLGAIFFIVRKKNSKA